MFASHFCFLHLLPCFSSLCDRLSFVNKPSGHVYVKLMDWNQWSKDDSLGEVAIPIKQLENGDPVEGWFPLENEPKKKKGPEKGEIRLKLHFPVKKVRLPSYHPALVLILTGRPRRSVRLGYACCCLPPGPEEEVLGDL